MLPVLAEGVEHRRRAHIPGVVGQVVHEGRGIYYGVFPGDTPHTAWVGPACEF